MGNTDIPVCLAYNQVHYEGLVPCSEEDILKTINLTKQFLCGEYKWTKENIPIFRNTVLNNSDKDSNQTQPVQKIIISNDSEKERECLLSLDDLKKIHPKKKTPQQNKEIKRLMDKKRKESMSDEKLAKIRKVQAQSMRKSRETLTLEDKTRIKIEDKERKQAS